MEIKARSRLLGAGPNVGALTALHRDEWSALFPMLNEYGLNTESVKAMTTAVSHLSTWSLSVLNPSATCQTHSPRVSRPATHLESHALQLCALSLDEGGDGSLAADCRRALYNGHSSR